MISFPALAMNSQGKFQEELITEEYWELLSVVSNYATKETKTGCSMSLMMSGTLWRAACPDVAQL
jgi:hypothetical protein